MLIFNPNYDMVHGGELSWLLGRIFEMESPGIPRTVLDFLNAMMVLLFYLILFIVILKRYNTGHNARNWVVFVISVSCGLASIEYFGAGIYCIAARNEGFSGVNYLCFVRGLIWFTLSITVLVRGSKWIDVLKVSWWIVFFLFISASNVSDLVQRRGIEILEIAPWAVNLLLFIYGLGNLRAIVSVPTLSSSFLEPLIVEESDKSHNDLREASFFSKLLFSWIYPLIRLGNSKPLNLDDIPCLISEDEALLAYEKLNDALLLETQRGANYSKNLVVRAIAKVHWKYAMLSGILALLRTISVVSAPLFLYAFVNYSNQDERNLKEGLFLVGILIAAKLVESLSHRHFYFISRRIGMTMRSALIVAVYKKQLRLSSLGRQRHSTGEIVNYIAVDAYRMGESVVWLHMGWASALQILSVIAVLYSVVGLGVLPGLVPFIVCGVLNVPFAKMLQKCQTEFMIVQDKRLRSLSEILNSMKIIKLHSWEEHFKNLTESLRRSEFKWLAETQYNKTYATVLYWMSPTIVSSVIFFGCLIFKSVRLDEGIIFTVLAALRSMSEPVRFLPEALSALIQIKVSFERINLFMLEDELKCENLLTHPSETSGHIISIEKSCFSWDPDAITPTLRAVELEVRRGQKIAVCGPVGAGKSSLLYALLGEIPKISGKVTVFGSVAYVSQVSWIQSGTIRDNILFGSPMDKVKYDYAIKMSALDIDIDSFDYGDLTEIGQRGLNMSGGQKQRIQLARAIYKDADIYLLDDPFSAVDAHTSAALFNDCVMTALAKKTVILVVHQVEFLADVDDILVMEGGHIVQSGSFKELMMTGTSFEQLVNAHKNVKEAFDPSSSMAEHERKIAHASPLELINTYASIEQTIGEIPSTTGVQLTQEEEKEAGDIGWKTFFDYVFVSKGTTYFWSSLISQFGFTALQATASFWLAFSIQNRKITSVVVVGIYALISSLSAVFIYLRTLFVIFLGLKASEAFFSGFTDSIFSASMLFFDSTPVGRILTRASSDLSILDLDIPVAFMFVISSLSETLAAIFIMASVTWQVFFVGIFALLALKYIQGYYQTSAMELMRINGTTKAPIMNYASETALGVATIRAFKMDDKFSSSYQKLVDKDAKVFLSSNAAMEWLVLRTEACQNLTVLTAVFLVVLLPNGYITPGLVGLSLSYAFLLTSSQVFLTRWFSSLVNYIVSVERIKQYMFIRPESPVIVKNESPPLSWPSNGRIELLDLKIRYRINAPIVLKGITCTINGGTRVGVVGRTGSGKTTLISSLFRLVEPYNGQIVIDGLDICSIGLKDLRLRLSIIPQEPTLFRGTVRTNLDPLGLHSDDEIWKALEKCQLKTIIGELPKQLDSSVSDEGENWSVGQRQLFSLGRVLLRRNRILVLDEATASIDSVTDAILQRIIRQEFSECTVITVAHRVPTVLDSDMVMVLSNGNLVEYDEPSMLMGTKSSFSKLVDEYWSNYKRVSPCS